MAFSGTASGQRAARPNTPTPPAAPAPTHGGIRRVASALSRHRTGYLLAAPSVVLLLAVFVGAMLTLLEYSFHRYAPGGADIAGSVATWREFLGSSYYWGVVRQTVILGALTTVIALVIGYPTAYGLHRIRRPMWRYVGYFIIFAPLMTSVVARTYGWQLVLGDTGVINSVLGAVSLGPVRMMYERTAVVIALVHILLPFCVFPIAGSLRQLDDAYGEAADDLGATAATRFRKVTVPLTLPGVIAGAELVFALSVSAFATPSLLGGGRVQVLATQIYQLVGNVDWPLAAVSSYVLLVLALAALALFSLAQRRVTHSGQGGVTAVAAPSRGVVGLGVWLAIVYAFVLLPLVIIVIDSFSSVAYGAWPPPGYSVHWYHHLFVQPGLGSAALLSLEIAVVATALALLIGTAAAVALVRHRVPGRHGMEAFIRSPVVVPKVAFGFAGFIYLHRIGLFGGLFGLVLTHVVITLPFVIIVVGAALVRADTTLQEAAMDLGAPPMRAFRLATLPQVRPALIAAALFAFVISFDEIDMTVFLLAPNQNTLPVWMYVYMQKFQDPTLAALSTLLIAVALLLAGIVAALLYRSGVAAAFTGAKPDTAGQTESSTPSTTLEEQGVSL